MSPSAGLFVAAPPQEAGEGFKGLALGCPAGCSHPLSQDRSSSVCRDCEGTYWRRPCASRWKPFHLSIFPVFQSSRMKTTRKQKALLLAGFHRCQQLLGVDISSTWARWSQALPLGSREESRPPGVLWVLRGETFSPNLHGRRFREARSWAGVVAADVCPAPWGVAEVWHQKGCPPKAPGRDGARPKTGGTKSANLLCFSCMLTFLSAGHGKWRTRPSRPPAHLRALLSAPNHLPCWFPVPVWAAAPSRFFRGRNLFSCKWPSSAASPIRNSVSLCALSLGDSSVGGSGLSSRGPPPSPFASVGPEGPGG